MIATCGDDYLAREEAAGGALDAPTLLCSVDAVDLDSLAETRHQWSGLGREVLDDLVACREPAASRGKRDPGRCESHEEVFSRSRS